MPRNRFGSLLVYLPYVILLFSVPAAAAGTNLYVSPSGNDDNACSQTLPCRQIRRALELVDHGDTILVANGTYKGFTAYGVHGTAGNPITIKAQGTNAEVVKTTDRTDNRDTIFITWSSYITIDGLRSFNANRAAIRVDESQHVTIRNCVLGDNGVWGIFADFSDDLLIEDNETYGSVDEHGIYASNSGDRPVIRANRVYDNNGNGIHVNGDISSGGDGIITGALIEGNIVYNNGRAGGSGINMDGVQGSTIRNNILYNNHATGIGMYQINGADGPRNNSVYHNTVHQASDGRYALLIKDSTGPITVRNNILYHPASARGGIVYLTGTDVANTNSDYNILDRVSPDDGGTVYSLDEWQAQGRETHSLSAIPTALFVNAAAGNYHLSATSPAIDRGQSLSTVTTDFEGQLRPKGAASDVGADEAGVATPGPDIEVTPTSLSFGPVSVGSTDDLTVTVRNTGVGTLTGSASTSAPFSVVGTASYSLAANQTATITVRFSPTASGAASRSLTLTGGGGASVSLSGTGETDLPALAVTPASLSFGSVSVGSTDDLTVTVRNSGGGTLNGSASTSSPFSVVGTASYSLAANETATITVRFSPTASGAASRSLTLTGGGGASVSLSGRGTGSTLAPELTVTPTILPFSSVEVGETRDLTVTVGNTGDGTLTGSASTGGSFSVVGTASYSIGADQTETITVRFSPDARGLTTGTLRLTGGGGGSVHLEGRGVGPSVGEPVAWTNRAGVVVAGNNLKKNAATGWGNSGATSTRALVSGPGYVECTAQETDKFRMLGLSVGQSSHNWQDIDFAIYPTANGVVRVAEKGVLKGTFGPYAYGDKLRVSTNGGVIRYWRNGFLIYTSATPPTYPLIVDTALYNEGATLAKVVISGKWVEPDPEPVESTGAGGGSVSANSSRTFP